MKEDKLKQFVDGNKEAFDSFEPPKAMFNSIAKELDNKYSKSKNGIVKVLWPLSIAATIALTLTISGLLNTSNSIEPNGIAEVEVNESLESVEVKQMREYYQPKIDQKLQVITVALGDEEEEKEAILSDVAEMDSLFVELKNELKENVDNEEVVAAMVKHYQLKLKMLEDLLFYLEHYSNKEIKKEYNEI